MGDLIAIAVLVGLCLVVREMQREQQHADEWAALRRHERRQRALARIGDEVRQ